MFVFGGLRCGNLGGWSVYIQNRVVSGVNVGKYTMHRVSGLGEVSLTILIPQKKSTIHGMVKIYRGPMDPSWDRDSIYIYIFLYITQSS